MGQAVRPQEIGHLRLLRFRKFKGGRAVARKKMETRQAGHATNLDHDGALTLLVAPQAC